MCSTGLIELDGIRLRRSAVLAGIVVLAVVAVTVAAQAGPAGTRGSDLAAVPERPVDLEDQQRLHDEQLERRRGALRDRYLTEADPASSTARQRHRSHEARKRPRNNPFGGGPRP